MTYGDTHDLLVASTLSSCLPNPLSPLSAPSLHSAWFKLDFDLAEKIDRKRRRAVRTPNDDMSFAQGYLRDACSPDGCYQVIPHGQVAVKLSGSAGN